MNSEYNPKNHNNISEDFIRHNFPTLNIDSLSPHRLHIFNPKSKNLVLDLTLPYENNSPYAEIRWPGGLEIFSNVNKEGIGQVQKFFQFDDEERSQIKQIKWEAFVAEWLIKLHGEYK